MLDQDTKRKIDNARDILVGKIPDPKSQVEQITISLIYKFMDDMDLESIEMGGVASFFTGDYQKYAWSKIFDRSLSGFELTNLYSEAIIKMNQNPNIPQLFRDIFKNAYLPYRDPETLRAFLKEINGFHYDHSERLGDAFEYLLSVLGSQGDAGQFRTPRHIIDFIVQVVNPQKNQTVLDPACGTAGFLISSYKNILAENTRDKRGDLLTPDERQRLMRNFAGYDISPDMVRLSLVNLYLHGFPDPIIHEYDTLTSEERWNETYDVILANPPFMTPKGGIRPHKRFSVQAKRSEVLFVDYIAEHLNPGGRAGVIVPEGIIFQSQNAYKKLRKMLVENYLYAVVSLPAGVFQPYAGVKTSVLLMDKTLSKRTDKILFVKIENDGYDPGAQRRPIDKNDLPKALEFLHDYRKTLLNNGSLENTDYAHIVDKSKIEESGDWNLSGERYKDSGRPISIHFEEVELGKVIEILDSMRIPIKKADRITGEYLYYGATGILDFVNDYIFDERLVLIGEDGAKWSAGEKTAFIAEGKYWVNNHAHVLRPISNRLIDTFLVEVINHMDLNEYITGVTVPKLNQQKLCSIKIPLPPLDIQKEIVAEIDGYQKIIDGARQVVENWKPTIKIDPEWEMVELVKVFKLSSGKGLTQKEQMSGNYKVYGGNGIKGVHNKYFIEEPILIIGRVGAYCGAVHITEPKSWITDNALYVTKYLIKINQQYLAQVLKQLNLNQYAKVGGQPSISQNTVYRLKVPFPPFSVQQKIVARIETEQEMVNANKKLIEIFEQKVKDKIGEVWGEEPTT